MSKKALIFDCYSVEPAGLSVPPYLGTYVRYTYSSLRASGLFSEIRYCTIDDFRHAIQPQGDAPCSTGYTDRRTYSLTRNATSVLKHLADADLVVAIAGDGVPSVHLHAQNGDHEELISAIEKTRGRKVLLGPAAIGVRQKPHFLHSHFDACHEQSLPATSLLSHSIAPLPYQAQDGYLGDFEGLLGQIPWRTIAEIELYRGCTRKAFCSFCSLAAKQPTVTFRDPNEVVREVGLLYDAGVRHFRIGQQACFFSYAHGEPSVIERLLSAIRTRCPDLEVLHIDNADPLAVASTRGRKVAKLVAEFCTEGNCAPMGIETFDPAVVERNNLTCTPDILLRAIEHIQEAGNEIGSLGQRRLLPGLNIVYGLPGETAATHELNLHWLNHIYEQGYYCHRTNIRPVAVYHGTPLASMQIEQKEDFDETFRSYKKQIEERYDRPMKRRVFPEGLVLRKLHAFYTSEEGTWFRRLGSYPIMVVDPRHGYARYTETDLKITRHEGRYIYGEALDFPQSY